MTVLAKSPLFAVLCAVDILTLLSISGRIKALGELDYSARAEPVASEGYESLGVVKAADAACGFSFTLLPICSEKSFISSKVAPPVEKPVESLYSRHRSA